MKRMMVLVIGLVAIPSLAFAHVIVRPGQSKPGAEERYTVRVPTEGQVATTSLQFDVPAGVTITDVPAAEDVKQELKKSGDRIISIVWTKEIPPKQLRSSRLLLAIQRLVNRSRGRRARISRTAHRATGRRRRSWSRVRPRPEMDRRRALAKPQGSRRG
jgi:hypothetical protein